MVGNTEPNQSLSSSEEYRKGLTEPADPLEIESAASLSGRGRTEYSTPLPVSEPESTPVLKTPKSSRLESNNSADDQISSEKLSKQLSSNVRNLFAGLAMGAIAGAGIATSLPKTAKSSPEQVAPIATGLRESTPAPESLGIKQVFISSLNSYFYKFGPGLDLFTAEEKLKIRHRIMNVYGASLRKQKELEGITAQNFELLPADNNPDSAFNKDRKMNCVYNAEVLDPKNNKKSAKKVYFIIDLNTEEVTLKKGNTTAASSPKPVEEVEDTSLDAELDKRTPDSIRSEIREIEGVIDGIDEEASRPRDESVERSYWRGETSQSKRRAQEARAELLRKYLKKRYGH